MIDNGVTAGAITQNPVGMGKEGVKAIDGEALPKVMDSGFYWYDKRRPEDLGRALRVGLAATSSRDRPLPALRGDHPGAAVGAVVGTYRVRRQAFSRAEIDVSTGRSVWLHCE